MKYIDFGHSVALSIMKKRIISDIQKNLVNIYLDEKDEKEQNKLLGMIEAINECKAFKKAKLFDKLDEYKQLVNQMEEYADIDFFHEKSYYEGCCDGVRRLIGLNKEFRNLSKKVILIFFTPCSDMEFEIYSAFLLSSNTTEIFEYNDSVETEKNYFLVTSDLNNIINILQQKDEEHEYAVIVSYDSEHTHNIEDMKILSEFCENNFYLFNNRQDKKVIETSKYIEKIIQEIK